MMEFYQTRLPAHELYCQSWFQTESSAPVLSVGRVVIRFLVLLCGFIGKGGSFHFGRLLRMG